MKSEILDVKSEIRNPKSERRPKPEGRSGLGCGLRGLPFGSRHSDFFRISGTRISDLKLIACLLAVLAVTSAFSQSNGIPGAQDYSAFSRFITDRNIFDPSRVAHSYSPTRMRSRRTHSNSAPGIQFVGTMNYDKGLFAFFSGNSSELSKVARTGDKVADYIVTDISRDAVQLESADKKQQFSLAIGDGFRQENGKWVRSGAGDIPAAPATSASAPAIPGTASAASDDNSEPAPAAASSADEPNEILKRLKQLREKENQ
jgi:hypothetical protein